MKFGKKKNNNNNKRSNQICLVFSSLGCTSDSDTCTKNYDFVNFGRRYLKRSQIKL